MGSNNLFDVMKKVTEGTYIREASNEWNSIELELVALKQRLMDKIDKADPKYDEVFNAFEALLGSVTTANRSQEEAPVASEAAADTDAMTPNPDNPEAAKPMEDGAGGGSDMTLESLVKESGLTDKQLQVLEACLPCDATISEAHVGFEKLKNKLAHEKGVKNPGALAAAIGQKKYGKKGMEKLAHKESVDLSAILSEKDDKKKEEEWADGRSHDEAVKQIVKDSMKELLTDGKFKEDKEPTRDEVMKEVEFQSKHGLDHREDASAIRYDAFKKVMKRIKNIAKKQDAESDATPEEEDTDAKSHYEASGFIGMKT